MSILPATLWRGFRSAKIVVAAAFAFVSLAGLSLTAPSLIGGVAHAAQSTTAAPAKEAAPQAQNEKVEIVIDKKTQRMVVYVGGQKRHEFVVSTGRAGYTTPSGTFRPSSMHKMAISVKYGNTPMPHTIFFTRVGHAIHATTAVKQLGRVASHGCIRLSPENAKVVYDLVKQMGLENTTIRIV
jgi:lipoprotein-anchoring transpeptidase ErfK/SrfK